MDHIFLGKPSEASLEISDLELVRNLANQRIGKRSMSSANPTSVLMTAATPSSTPLIQPVLPLDQFSIHR